MSGLGDLPVDRDNYIISASLPRGAGREETLRELLRALYLLRPEWFDHKVGRSPCKCPLGPPGIPLWRTPAIGDAGPVERARVS